jgi:hypothetical protein
MSENRKTWFILKISRGLGRELPKRFSLKELS